MALVWNEPEQVFDVVPGTCPSPAPGDDGSARGCIANGNCGCDETLIEKVAQAMQREDYEQGGVVWDDLPEYRQGDYLRLARIANRILQDPFRNKLRDFLRWSMASGPWGGNDMDGMDVQDQAERLGLIVKVPYDPAQHGEANCEIEPGADWFVMAPGINP